MFWLEKLFSVFSKFEDFKEELDARVSREVVEKISIECPMLQPAPVRYTKVNATATVKKDYPYDQ